MKKKKDFLGRVGAFLLAFLLALSLAGCGNGDVESTGTDGQSAAGENKKAEDSGASASKGGAKGAAMGRWVERDITPEGADFLRLTPVVTQDGSLVMYGKTGGRDGQLMRYTSEDDGQNWSSEPLDWEQKTNGNISTLSYLADGTCFFSSYQFDEEQQELIKTTYWLKKADTNELSECPFLEDRNSACFMLMDADTLFMLSQDEQGKETYEIINPSTGEVLQTLDDLTSDMSGYLGGTALDVSDAQNPRIYYSYYTVGSEEVLSVFDKQGKVEDKIAKISASGMTGTTDPDGNYYYVSDGNICRIAKGGSIQEQIVDDDGFQLGLANFFCTDLLYINDKNFFCVLSDMNARSTKLMQYTWDESVPSEAETVLNVWSLKDNATVRAAVACCKSRHPEIDVKYEVGMPEDGEVSEEDVVRSLNTQLMAKEGPDVLILDGLDYENYISKGILTDISDAVSLEELKQNIIAPFIKEDGAVYALPARFSVPVIIGDAGDLDGMDSLAALKEAVLSGAPRPNLGASDEAYYAPWSAEERYALGFIDLDSILDFAMQTSQTALVQDGAVNTQAVSEVLDFVGSVGAYYGMNKYPEQAQSAAVASSREGADMVEISDGALEYSMTAHARFGWDLLQTPAYFMEARRTKSANPSKAKSDVLVRPGLVPNAFLPSTLAGMTQSSQSQEAAKLFIEILFSADIQDFNQEDGCPVRADSLKQSIQKHEKYVKESGYDGDMNAFFDSLENAVTDSRTIQVMRGYLKGHAKQMIAGSESLEQAVSGVESDISLMLREQEW